MKISYHKVNFKMDFNFPENLEEINNHINSVWRNLPSLTITSDQKLLDKTINITQDFAKNKKQFIVFGTGGSNLGAKAMINICNWAERLGNGLMTIFSKAGACLTLRLAINPPIKIAATADTTVADTAPAAANPNITKTTPDTKES